MNRSTSFPKFAFVLFVLGILNLASARAAAQEAFLVDGIFQVINVHGSRLAAAVEGDLYLDSDGPRHFTIDAHVKVEGNHIEGTPTMVFDDGSTLTLYYEIKLDKATGIFEGTFWITGGTGEFAGASGGGEICYPVSASGPLMMDGVLLR